MRRPRRSIHSGRCASVKLAPPADGGNAVAGEVLQSFQKRRLTVVAGVVVGYRERIESPTQNAQHGWIGAEAENLVVEGLPHGSDRTFQVADAIVGILQLRGKGSQGITAATDQATRPVVEHDVPDKNQVDGGRSGGAGGGRHKHAEHADDAEQQTQNGYPVHWRSPLAEDNAHQYCSSPSRIGS
jgi:hypothetical protein